MSSSPTAKPSASWRSRALAAIDATIVDWTARPLGPHGPRFCPLCWEFREAECRGCPIIGYSHRRCNRVREHRAYRDAYLRGNGGKMTFVAHQLVMRMRLMRAAVVEARVRECDCPSCVEVPCG